MYYKMNRMETPFIFGRVAKNENFTDREKETGRLVSGFNSLINTIIISPRCWGKSSLVAKAADEASAANSSLRICFIDMFSIRDEAQFYMTLAHSVLKGTSSKWEEAVSLHSPRTAGLI